MSKTLSKHRCETNDNVSVDENTLPAKIKFNRAFILPIRMPGHASAAVTVQFREGQLVDDPQWIQALLHHQAPITAVN